MTKEKLLALLRAQPGEYVSGQSLAQTLGITRAAVWKAAQALRGSGYDIMSSTNRGYCLVSGPETLTEQELSAALQTQVIGKKLIVLESVESTNPYLRALADAGAPDGTAVLARRQTGGRGRLGRGFDSPADMGLYCSVLLRPDLPPERLMTLTGRVAVAACDAIEEAADLQPGIKWVNDLVSGGRKLCGILTELSLSAESGRVDYVVVGIGINLSQRAGDFPPELREKATSLSLLGHPASPVPLACALLASLERMYLRLCAGDDGDLARYRALCLTIGQRVCLLRGEGGESGFAEDVDDTLGLVIRFPNGAQETLRAGEVSVRGEDGYV